MKNKTSNSDLDEKLSTILSKASKYKLNSLNGIRKESNPDHYYDDDITTAISEEFTDRISVYPLIGDLIRFMGGFLRKRTDLSPSEFVSKTVELFNEESITRMDVAKLTKIGISEKNTLIPFMNGGPAGECWNKADNGFYDWIDNKSKESIIGIELGFKADDYGLEVSKKLIEKKKSNPDMYVGILVDGFVSILMQKPPKSLQEFEQNTITMLEDMIKAGIDVIINTSSDPVSKDFLAANHVKLWIFDGESAFFGGIGIESQFRTLLYDEMDLVHGPFVTILSLMAMVLMKNQRSLDNSFLDIKQKQKMNKELMMKLFVKTISVQGNISMKISMDVPGYIQDAQKEYIRLLVRKDVDEIFILVPYFSDHKVAKGVIIAAKRIYDKLAKEKLAQLKLDGLSKQQIHDLVDEELEKEKKIHVIFPTQPENPIIADVSKYYAYYLRNNPIVETKQFFVQDKDKNFKMLHAKQMVVVLRDATRNWTKYVKFGGSYNPAGRAQNMWELNATEFCNTWNESDEDGNTSPNTIKDYLNNVMKNAVDNYSTPYPWGAENVKLSILDRISMNIARWLWI